MPSMPDAEEARQSPGTILCKSCGLCCTGHLFSWVRLKASELDSSQALGLHVIRSDPRQRGFTQPCPLWQGQCTVYTSPHYPRGCRTYQCKLLKEVLDDNIPPSESLNVVQRAKEMIKEVETLLPPAPNLGFRERLIAQMEQGDPESELLGKADALLIFFDTHFGVNDFFDEAGER